MVDTACTVVLLARDAATTVEAAVRSVVHLADEVIVYDTGSHDGTPDVARAAGAAVVAGPWPGDFAAARTAAWAHVRTPWAFSLDADEVWTGTVPLPDLVATHAGPAQALHVTVANLPPGHPRPAAAHGPGRLRWALTDPAFTGAHRHPSVRLARVGAVRWQGQVHERLVAGDLQAADLRTGDVPETDGHLRHDGYADLATALAKARRNGDLAHDPLVRASALYAQARFAEAEPVLRDVAATPGPDAPVAAELLVHLALVLGRPGDAELAHLRRLGVDPGYARWLEARLELARDRPAHALALLDGVTVLVDTKGCSPGPVPLLLTRAEAHARVGDTAAALAELVQIAVGLGQPAGLGPYLLALATPVQLAAAATHVATGDALTGLATELATCGAPGEAAAVLLRG